MSNFQALHCKITAVTPLHFNTGNILAEEKDFYIHEDVLHRLHYIKLLANLPEANFENALAQVREHGLQSLLPKPEKKSPKAKAEEDWKQILRAKVGLASAEPKEKAKEWIAGDIFQKALEAAEMYQQPTNFVKGDLISKIHAMALDNWQRVFIPGSCMKGVLRTALYLGNLLEQRDRLSRLRFTWTDHAEEADYPLDREMAGTGRYEFSHDIFRQILVRDSECHSAKHTLGLYQVKILDIGLRDDQPIVFWKRLGREDSEEEGRPEKPWQSQYPIDRPSNDGMFWEMIVPGSTFNIEMIFDIWLRDQMAQQTQGEKPALFFEPESVLSVLRSFSRSMIQQELQFAQTYRIDYLRSFYQDLLKKLEASGNVAYLPIGAGVPWHGKTIGLSLDSVGLDTIRRHFYRYMGKFIHQEKDCEAVFHASKLRKGVCPRCNKIIRSDRLACISPFPKTRHIVFGDNGSQFPPGWIALEM